MEMHKELSALIVDDSRLNRMVIIEYLKGKDFNILEAEDGQQALDVLATQSPDIILLDLIMPVLDGFQVLEVLKEKKNKIPVIVITAYLKDNTVQRCKDLGAAGFLNKPIKMHELFTMIANLLDDVKKSQE